MSYKADHHSLNSPLITTQEPLIDFDNLSESELKKRCFVGNCGMKIRPIISSVL